MVQVLGRSRDRGGTLGRGIITKFRPEKIRLVNLKPGICFLVGAKTQTGQTALKMEVVLSNLDLKFSAQSDKHQSDDLGRRLA